MSTRALVRTSCAAAFCALLAAGCAATRTGNSAKGGDAQGLTPIRQARTAMTAGNLEAAEAVLARALSVPAGRKATAGPDTAELLMLRAELRIRQGRYPEAEGDALTAMALVPSTVNAPMPDGAAPDEPYGPRDLREGAEKDDQKKDAPLPRPDLTQRTIHIRLAQLYEDAGHDDYAEHHLVEARKLCLEDPQLVERRDCDFERHAAVRILMARGNYSKAEPLVLGEIADVQSLFGPDDIRLSFAMCNAARFYARQGKYTLSGPLYTRSFELWKTVREEAYQSHTRAIAAGQPSPFDAAFLRARAGHSPFAAPCGLEDQGLILYKLGKPGVAADAIRYEQQLWAADTQAGVDAVAWLDSLVAKGGDPLALASARHAVAFAARRKGDLVRAEQELRLVVEAYAEAWPTLALSDRRFYSEDYLAALESLIDLLRSSKRFPEALALGERATQIAAATVNEYDSVRLDSLLSLAKTYREMRDSQKAEETATGYLEAVVRARGDTSPDYAWALRTISYAYLLSEELDASQRMEMQAKAIWAKQNIAAPEF